ncbi:hypothetical protein ACTJJY_28370 [Bacillus sp. 22475]
MYVVCIRNKKSPKKETSYFLYGGVITDDGLLSIFLLPWQALPYSFIYNMLENQRKETNGSF